MKAISGIRSQSGAVSLFVVIFATLLITVVTLGFLRIMINDQNQATSSDLSQSAYDSSQAGVEDAKRALLKYKSICADTTPAGVVACDTAALSLESTVCNKGLRDQDIIDKNGTGEVVVQQSQGGSSTNDLNQAYTCVLMKLKTDDYVGSLAANESKLIPLVPVKNAVGVRAFTTIQIEWFSSEDVGNSTGAVSLPSVGTKTLTEQTSWPSNRPSVLRSQLIQYGGSFTLANFDSQVSGQSDAATVFLYPTSGVTGGTTASPFAFATEDKRKVNPAAETTIAPASSAPLARQCVATVSGGAYACTVRITLPTPINAGDRTAYLRLTPFYNGTHFRVTMYQNLTPVKFDAVQPIVDSTGRADTLFRRIESRVDLIDTSFPYPNGAVETSGNLCKNIRITDRPEDYSNNNCTP